VLATWDGSESADRTLQVPNNVAVDAEGRVFVTEFNGNRVQVFAPDGTLLGTWGEHGSALGQFDEPRGIALDGQGGAYVTEWAGNRVQKFRLLPPLAPAIAPDPTSTPTP
jgi:sugar lactone lactonase YvrE